jgi:ribosomal-protein-alanine N-acetyltransferase
MKVTIETEKLILRPLALTDAEVAYTWASDPIVNKYMIYPLHQSINDTYEWLNRVINDSDNPLKCDLAFTIKGTNELIGTGGFYYKEDSDRWEVGYNLKQSAWGKGYATEATLAMIKYAHEVLGVTKYGSSYARPNQASKNVLTKCGFVFDSEFEYKKLDGSVKFVGEKVKLDL